MGQLGVSVSWDQTEEEAGRLVITASTVPTFEDIYSSRELTQGCVSIGLNQSGSFRLFVYIIYLFIFD